MSDHRNAAPQPEATRRGPILSESVVLVDGLTWGLARPTLRYHPEFCEENVGHKPERATTRADRSGYPWNVEALVDRLGAACRAGTAATDDRERFDALMALASALLRRVHEINSTQVAVLLDLDPEGLVRLVDAVLRAIDRPLAPQNSGVADANA